MTIPFEFSLFLTMVRSLWTPMISRIILHTSALVMWSKHIQNVSRVLQSKSHKHTRIGRWM